MENIDLKKKYGWSEDLEKFTISTNPKLKDEFSGYFRIKKHKGKLFWYYRLSTDSKARDKYLSSVEPKDLEPNQSSFQYAVKILLHKLDSNFVMGLRNKSYMHTYISLYKERLDNDKHLVESTIRGRINSVGRFSSWCKSESVRMNIVPTNDMKDVFLKYILYLRDKGLQKASIKVQTQSVRYFLDWVCEDKLLDGLGLFPSHPISVDLQNALLKKHIVTVPTEIKKFKSSFYKESYETCNKKIQNIWQTYCENLGVLDRIRDKNGKINQPPHMIGRDIVYFVSYLQIRMGFRLSEVFYSYRNVDVYNGFHLENTPNEMASFWEKSDSGWILHIKKSKNKNRSVPFTDTIRSWVMPPSEEILKVSEVKLDKKGKPLYWDTPFVDICMELFPHSYYLFPSPNNKENPNSRRSKTHYMNEFKSEMVLNNGWDRFGINSSHDLRKFFVSHSIANSELTPFQISQITGHNLITMEKFYIRDNMKEKFEHFKKITQKDLLTTQPK